MASIQRAIDRFKADSIARAADSVARAEAHTQAAAIARHLNDRGWQGESLIVTGPSGRQYEAANRFKDRLTYIPGYLYQGNDCLNGQVGDRQVRAEVARVFLAESTQVAHEIGRAFQALQRKKAEDLRFRGLDW
jgi:osmotically-inducible protein OsmY